MIQDARARSNGPKLEWERFRLSTGRSFPHEEATHVTSIPWGFQGLTGLSSECLVWCQHWPFGQEGRLGLSQPHLTYHLLISTSWKWGTALNTQNKWQCYQADSSCTEPEITHCRCDGQHPASKWQATLFLPFCFLKIYEKLLRVCASLPDRNPTTQSSSVKTIYGLKQLCSGQGNVTFHYMLFDTY